MTPTGGIPRQSMRTTRTALALCLAAERKDRAAFDTLIRSTPGRLIVAGLVGIVRGYMQVEARRTGETLEELYRRAIDNLVDQEASAREPPDAITP